MEMVNLLTKLIENGHV